MIDFHNPNFNKIIKTTKPKKVTTTSNLTSYRLSDKIFTISIGDRILTTELEPTGEVPVYSANVNEIFGYVNKTNLKDFSQDSILWGIDGDWMVNIIPKNQKFYPTDHCGVLRIETDEINPNYMALALEQEGLNEKFSRTKRASTKMIKNLTIEVPTKVIQDQIVEEFSTIQNSIQKELDNIIYLDKSITQEFVSTFGTIDNNAKNFSKCQLTDVCDFEGGSQPPKSEWSFTPQEGYIRMLQIRDFTQIGKYDNEYIKLSKSTKICRDDDILIGRYGASIGKILTGLSGAYNVAIIKTIPDENKITKSYLNGYLTSDYFQGHLQSLAKTRGAQAGFNKEDLSQLSILIPPLDLQQTFDQKVKKLTELKQISEQKIQELNEQRKEKLQKYFNQ